MKHVFNKRTTKGFYSIGDTFRLEPTQELYVLALVDNKSVQLININTGNRFSKLQQCGDVFAITQEEFDRISNYRGDSLIKIAQLAINTIERDANDWLHITL